MNPAFCFFILEEDGQLTQQILYEYLGMNLSYAPRVWHAKNASTGLKMLSDRSYDLVIVMMRIADMDPITFGEKVKAEYIRRSDEIALTNYLEWLRQRYNVIYDEKFDE